MSQLLNDMFFVSFRGKQNKYENDNMQLSVESHIFTFVHIIKAVHNKSKMQLMTMCHGNKELTAGFTRFYQDY